LYIYLSSNASEEEMRVFFVKDCAQEFNFLYDWNRATIEEKLWVRVKFAETTKMNAYRLGSRELKPIGVSPFL